MSEKELIQEVDAIVAKLNEKLEQAAIIGIEYEGNFSVGGVFPSQKAKWTHLRVTPKVLARNIY